MEEDLSYCASSFLQYRCIVDRSKTFRYDIVPRFCDTSQADDLLVNNSNDLERHLKTQCERLPGGGRTAIALSGGIDSAILAKFVPKGTIAYTFKCIVPGVDVVDESIMAAKYAQQCGLEHRIVEVYWEDFERYAPILMKHKGAPIHSIEVQIYKAALEAKSAGAEVFVFGESADVKYGGLSSLLSRDWLFGEFVDRYSYVLPYRVIKDSKLVLRPIKEFTMASGMVDTFGFVNRFFFLESMGSYTNACGLAGINFIAPYAHTRLNVPLDINRIRGGDGKYFVREVFKRNYPNISIPPKTPMPRPMNEWLSNWQGPNREEFWPNCTKVMTGDQKWLVWALEKFLDVLDGKVSA